MSGLSFANTDCLSYKINPRIDITEPKYTKKVVQPETEMTKLHGNVVATLIDNYDIIVDVVRVFDGYCVVLKSVNATIGYSDFLIQVDSRNVPNSCEYNAILQHEDKHINTYLSVVQDFQKQLHDAVFTAAKSVTPVFIKDYNNTDLAIDKLNADMQTHPDIILIRQKIRIAQELRNKRIDQNEDNTELKKCGK